MFGFSITLCYFMLGDRHYFSFHFTCDIKLLDVLENSQS